MQILLRLWFSHLQTPLCCPLHSPILSGWVSTLGSMASDTHCPFARADMFLRWYSCDAFKALLYTLSMSPDPWVLTLCLFHSSYSSIYLLTVSRRFSITSKCLTAQQLAPRQLNSGLPLLNAVLYASQTHHILHFSCKLPPRKPDFWCQLLRTPIVNEGIRGTNTEWEALRDFITEWVQ